MNIIDYALTAIMDSYKIGMSQLHDRKFTLPDGKEAHTVISSSYSNFTPRTNSYMKFSNYSDNKLVVWGTRHTFNYIINLFKKGFFEKEWSVVERRIKRVLSAHFGNEGRDQEAFVSCLKELHELGFLPLTVKALREGTRVQTGIPVFTVRARDGFGWLVNMIETISSNLIWPMINAATINEQFFIQARLHAMKSIPEEMRDFWCSLSVHDFSLRGLMGPEAGLRMGSAHSLYFQGSDTVGVMDFIEEEYDHDIETCAPVAVSVRATEHADITRLLSEYRARGFNEDTEYYVMMELGSASHGVLSYVADTENYFRTITKYARMCREMILARKDRADGQPARFVFRPDSSRKTPLEVICGYDVYNLDQNTPLTDIQAGNWPSDTAWRTPDGKIWTWVGSSFQEISEDEARGSLECLWEVFGGFMYKEFRVINPKVGLIYGEAISRDMHDRILTTMERKGFSAFNILVGKGSYAVLEGNTRDLLSMTYKQTFSTAQFLDISTDTVELVQQKKPMGADYKKSAAGLLSVSYDSATNMYVLNQNQTEEQYNTGLLVDLVVDGVIIPDGNSFVDIQKNHRAQFDVFLAKEHAELEVGVEADAQAALK